VANFALARTPMYDAQGNLARAWLLYFQSIEPSARQFVVVTDPAYGADPSLADNTAAFAAAIASLPANGGTVYVPPGTFRGSFANLPAYPKALRILGAGESATIIQPAAANTPVFSLSAVVPNFGSPKIEFSSITIMGHPSGSTGMAVDVRGITGGWFHDITFQSATATAWSSATAYVPGVVVVYLNIRYISISASTNAAPSTNPLDWSVGGDFAQGFLINDQSALAGGNDNTIERITAVNQSGPVTVAKLSGTVAANHMRGWSVRSNDAGMLYVIDIDATGTNVNSIEDCDFEGNLAAVAIRPGGNTLVKSCYFENNLKDIEGNGGPSVRFDACLFSGAPPKISNTGAEVCWTFDDCIGYIETLIAGGQFISAGAKAGAIRYNLGIGSMTGGIRTKPILPLGSPVGIKFTDLSTSLAAGTYTWRITAVNAAGESGPGAPVTATVSGTQSVIFVGDAHNGAAWYRIWGRGVAGLYGALATVPATFASQTGLFTDNGTLTPGGAAWSSVTTYAAGTHVLYSGVTYWALQASLNAQPNTSPDQWGVIGTLNLPTVNTTGNIVGGAASLTDSLNLIPAEDSGSANNALVVTTPLGWGVGSWPWPDGWAFKLKLQHTLQAGANTITVNANLSSIVSDVTLGNIFVALPLNSVITFTYDAAANHFQIGGVGSQAFPGGATFDAHGTFGGGVTVLHFINGALDSVT
jgi:hypothetical protein